MKSLTFNNIKKPWLYLLQGRYKPPFAPIQRDLIYVPGMDGAYLGNTSLRPLYINQPVGFVVKNDEHALQLKDELADWLMTNEPVPLQFDDEPGRTYYAVVQNTIEDFERFVNLRQGTIQFLCLDPYSYGEEQTIEFQSDSVMVENKGTAETEPIFELTAKEPTTFAMISNGEEYMAIGNPVDLENQEPAEELTTTFEHDMSNFIGWSDVPGGHTWVDPFLGGIVAGSFGIGTGQWYVTDYGSNPHGWHGPSKRTVFDESLQDFQVDFSLSSLNFVGDVGKVGLFLLDDNDNIVASMGVRDNTIGVGYHNKTRFVLGGQKTIFDYDGFNNSGMWLRLRREGNKFTAMLYKVNDDGTMSSRVTRYYEDTLGDYLTPIKQAAVYIANYKNRRVIRMYANHLKVSKVNDLSENQVPYIANEGDVITFNHVTGDCYINGEPVPFDFGADFFALKKGVNNLTVLPENTFDVSIKYRERYK